VNIRCNDEHPKNDEMVREEGVGDIRITGMLLASLIPTCR
jgi:hypothetical protein